MVLYLAANSQTLSQQMQLAWLDLWQCDQDTMVQALGSMRHVSLYVGTMGMMSTVWSLSTWGP